MKLGQLEVFCQARRRFGKPPRRHCHVKLMRPAMARKITGITPRLSRPFKLETGGGSGGRRGGVAVEGIVDRSVDGEKPLDRRRRFEALHLRGLPPSLTAQQQRNVVSCVGPRSSRRPDSTDQPSNVGVGGVVLSGKPRRAADRRRRRPGSQRPLQERRGRQPRNCLRLMSLDREADSLRRLQMG
jgi:hypothetical protein